MVPQVLYPKEFPAKEIGQVVGYLRGAVGVDLGCAAECAWNIQGYAMGEFIPHQHADAHTSFHVDFSGLSDAQLADKLEGSQSFGAPAGSPWVIILLPIVSEIMRRLLERFLPR